MGYRHQESILERSERSPERWNIVLVLKPMLTRRSKPLFWKWERTMGLTQAVPVLGDQGRSVEEHAGIIFGGSAVHIRNIGVDTITIEVDRARGFGHHERGRGESDDRVYGTQGTRLWRVEDVHLRSLGERVRLWRVGRSHKGISHHNTSIV